LTPGTRAGIDRAGSPFSAELRRSKQRNSALGRAEIVGATPEQAQDIVATLLTASLTQRS
jgi:hypothetical protein